MRVRLTDAENAAVTQAAAARGMRPSDLACEALLAFIGRAAEPQPAMAAVATAPVLARLDALAATLGRHVADLARLVPAAEDAAGEREDVRTSLADIANAIGVMAGSIVPIEPDDDVEAAFGPDRD